MFTLAAVLSAEMPMPYYFTEKEILK